MSVKVVNNRTFLPDFRGEGIFLKPIKICDIDKSTAPVHKRLYSHHTLSSVRKFKYFKVTRAPKDTLDFILSSSYNHSKELFPDKEDTYLQKETIGVPTWRRLKNDIIVPPPVIIPLGHPLVIGGITERRVRDNIKLMNAGHHSAKTAPGYSRQPAGGTVFYY